MVDTTLFADFLNGNLRGITSGAQKHVVERYMLTEDHTQLTVDISWEDPEYLQQSATASVIWDHAPDKTMMPFACDPQNARLSDFE